jgi:hypothetical protein
MAQVNMGRMAFREEGEHWNAYYALPNTMEGAIWLGSIAMRFVERPARKEQFMSLMRECFGDVMEQVIGQRPTWPDGVQPAPEHERSRRA